MENQLKRMHAVAKQLQALSKEIADMKDNQEFLLNELPDENEITKHGTEIGEDHQLAIKALDKAAGRIDEALFSVNEALECF
jgi:Tfp pilus assembly protein PilO